MAEKGPVISNSAYENDIALLNEMRSEMNSLVDEYVTIMQSIYDDKILEGASAENLLDFSNIVKENLTGLYEEYTSAQSGDMQQFLTDVENADKK